jgi:hypothetical protein
MPIPTIRQRKEVLRPVPGEQGKSIIKELFLNGSFVNHLFTGFFFVIK